MIGLDTNVLVRYIAQDEPRQAAKAVHLIEEVCGEARPGFVTIVALAELVWVLEECYDSAKTDVAAILERILRTKQFVVEDAETVWKAVRLFEASPADFADCLIDRVGAAHDCEYTATFDKGAAKAGMHLIE
ncbi:MAG: type II toxin-antitoxin system VapC family toxin [Casimicrobiaceae bacterium]